MKHLFIYVMFSGVDRLILKGKELSLRSFTNLRGESGEFLPVSRSALGTAYTDNDLDDSDDDEEKESVD
jgi:hypothetical protein